MRAQVTRRSRRIATSRCRLASVCSPTAATRGSISSSCSSVRQPRLRRGRFPLPGPQDLAAQPDALVANVDAGPGDHLLDFRTGLGAERAAHLDRCRGGLRVARHDGLPSQSCQGSPDICQALPYTAKRCPRRKAIPGRGRRPSPVPAPYDASLSPRRGRAWSNAARSGRTRRPLRNRGRRERGPDISPRTAAGLRAAAPRLLGHSFCSCLARARLGYCWRQRCRRG